MKNYNEMANDVLRRIGEHEIKQRNRRKVMKKVIIPTFCFCLVALLGISLWQVDFFAKKPSTQLENSSVIGEQDLVDNKDGSGENNDTDGDFSPNGQEAPPSDSDNSAASENSDTTNSNGVIDVIGMVKYGGTNYVQCSTSATVYTPDKYLGEAHDFEGTYQTDFDDISGGLYMAKEDPDVLMVELKNSEYTDYVILIKEQN